MIVADTSALLTILFEEPDAARCTRVLETEPDIHMSAGTLAEALIILAHRGGSELLLTLVDALGITIDPVTSTFAERVGEAHGRWGRGAHAAKLNFGDCFAYALAKEFDCPLLFVGEDFARTDVRPALS